MTSELPVPPEYIGFMRNIVAGNFKAAARYIWLNPVLKEHLKSLLFTEIKLEAQDICSNKESSFRLNNINELKEKLCYMEKHGDGERIIRLYKFLLLYFRLEHRTKYSYYTLYTLCQVHQLLPPKLAHELVWNRTNNSRGLVDSNVENDSTVEHH